MGEGRARLDIIVLKPSPRPILKERRLGSLNVNHARDTRPSRSTHCTLLTIALPDTCWGCGRRGRGMWLFLAGPRRFADWRSGSLQIRAGQLG